MFTAPGICPSSNSFFVRTSSTMFVPVFHSFSNSPTATFLGFVSLAALFAGSPATVTHAALKRAATICATHPVMLLPRPISNVLCDSLRKIVRHQRQCLALTAREIGSHLNECKSRNRFVKDHLAAAPFACSDFGRQDDAIILDRQHVARGKTQRLATIMRDHAAHDHIPRVARRQ